jgi:hypothetical protein
MLLPGRHCHPSFPGSNQGMPLDELRCVEGGLEQWLTGGHWPSPPS